MFYNQKNIFSFLFLKMENMALFDNYYLKQIYILEILQNKKNKGSIWEMLFEWFSILKNQKIKKKNTYDNQKLFCVLKNRRQRVFKEYILIVF